MGGEVSYAAHQKIFKRKILSECFSCVEHLMMEEYNTVMINK